MQIWNKIKVDNQRSILKYTEYENLINTASEMVCGFDKDEHESPKERETPQKRTNELNSEIEEEEEESTTTKKQKKIVIDDEEDEDQTATKSKKQNKRLLVVRNVRGEVSQALDVQIQTRPRSKESRRKRDVQP